MAIAKAIWREREGGGGNERKGETTMYKIGKQGVEENVKG